MIIRADGTEGHFATSYAIKADELYYTFPTAKYMKIKKEELPSRLSGCFRQLYGEIFRYFFHLMIKDIIENLVSFKLPAGCLRTWIEMVPVSGDDFIRARENGAFLDVDYLVSNNTGYNLCLRYNTRYGNWKKKIYVSHVFKDRITELTNQGVGW